MGTGLPPERFLLRGSGRYHSRNVASTVEYRDALPDAVEFSVFKG